MNFKAEEWVEHYKKKDALWIHDGNPRRPHALLTSGFHSSGFFNSRLVIPDDLLLLKAAEDIVESLKEIGFNISDVEVVVGPETGATTLARFIARVIKRLRGTYCYSVSPAKTIVDGQKAMTFNHVSRNIVANRQCLLVEDVITTGGSIDLAANTILQCGGSVLPYVGALVNRSGAHEIKNKKVVALVSKHMPTFTAEECLLCKQGSEPLRAKDRANWQRLNTTY